MHSVSLIHRIEDAQSAIKRPDTGVDFHSPKLHFLENCVAHFVCNKECFPKKVWNLYKDTAKSCIKETNSKKL